MAAHAESIARLIQVTVEKILFNNENISPPRWSLVVDGAFCVN